MAFDDRICREIMNVEQQPVTIQITRPEIEALINQRLKTGAFKDAEDVILRALQSSQGDGPDAAARRDAIERLKTFGKKHGLSLGGMTIHELRHEARKCRLSLMLR